MSSLKKHTFILGIVFVLSLFAAVAGASEYGLFFGEESLAGVDPLLTTIDDLNRDGVFDLVTFNEDGSILLFLGNGDGTYANAVIYSEEEFLLLVTAADPNSEETSDVESTATSDATFSALQASQEVGRVIYVDDNAPAGGDGSSWAAAYKYLQDALACAVAGDEIRIAQGTYKPDQGGGITPGDRNATFQLINGVSLKGGYAGLGEPHPDDRNIETYETILSGDLNGDDGPVLAVDFIACLTPPDGAMKTGCDALDFDGDNYIGSNDMLTFLEIYNYDDNSHRVVTSTGANISTTLDGFTITAGNRFVGGGFPYGAGMSIQWGSPIVINCTFSRNFSVGGGAMHNYRSNPTIMNCIFINNAAYVGGGAIYNQYGVYAGGSSVDPYIRSILTNCVFIGNLARTSGAIHSSYSSIMVTNCKFSRNSATVGPGGAIVQIGSCYLEVTNSTFTGNSTFSDGGAMYNQIGSPILTNCTFTGNTAGHAGGGIYCRFLGVDQRFPSPSITNCILWGDTAGTNGAEIFLDTSSILTISHSDVEGGVEAVYVETGSTLNWGEGNIGLDPCFVDADGTDDIIGTEDDNLRLLSDSPCIDAGDNNSLPPDIVDLDGDGNTAEPIPFDLAGKARIRNGIVDMGAFEALQDPRELIVELALDVIDLNLQQGISNSLDAKVDTALKTLEDINENNDVAAINSLQAFINAVEAQRGNKISEADADALIAVAQRIIGLLSTE